MDARVSPRKEHGHLGHLVLCSLLGMACASNKPAGVDPKEMSARAHMQEAAKEEQQAQMHAAQYRPEERAVVGKQCVVPDDPQLAFPCWASSTNPTAWHLREAKWHEQHAQAHRQASVQLRQAEDRACRGIPNEDRDMGPFYHCEDITTVDPIQDGNRVLGARVTYRAIPAMTIDWLRRITECHQARYAALGNLTHPANHACPLDGRGISAQVSQSAAGFVLDLRAHDEAAAKTMVNRAQGFLRCGADGDMPAEAQAPGPTGTGTAPATAPGRPAGAPKATPLPPGSGVPKVPFEPKAPEVPKPRPTN